MNKFEKKLKKIIKETAEEHGVSQDIVKMVYTSAFTFTANVIRSADKHDYSTFKTVMIPLLGKFYPKSKRSIERKIKRKKEREESKAKEHKKYVLIDSTDK